ncbi:hypothetical protein PEBR_07913 [Penicillium brasilianum]|uniref:Uncharacterized protein n=1 Tax=Penicillium brasilianum TaxID=104259 RepID=A0A1S9RX04_PENBI|nr:hypothetical protein PEBR_07913 [Penicillium brasilianum]
MVGGGALLDGMREGPNGARAHEPPGKEKRSLLIVPDSGGQIIGYADYRISGMDSSQNGITREIGPLMAWALRNNLDDQPGALPGLCSGWSVRG